MAFHETSFYYDLVCLFVDFVFHILQSSVIGQALMLHANVAGQSCLNQPRLHDLTVGHSLCPEVTSKRVAGQRLAAGLPCTFPVVDAHAQSVLLNALKANVGRVVCGGQETSGLGPGHWNFGRYAK